MNRAALVTLLVFSLAGACKPSPSPMATPVVDVASPVGGAASPAPLPSATRGGSCEVRWDACRRVAGPIRVSGDHVGQGAEVAWDGGRILVLYEDFPAGQMGGPLQTEHLVAFRPQGDVDSTDTLPGRGAAHLVWNPSSRTGLVTTSESIAWLGTDGHPTGEPVPVPKVVNVSFDGAPFAAGPGFVVVNGVGGHTSTAVPSPFSFAVVGASPGPVTWTQLDPSGERFSPVGARGADGLVTWLWSSQWRGGGTLHRVARDGGVGTGLPLSLPAGVRVRAVHDAGADPYLVLVSPTFDVELAPVQGGKLGASQPLGARVQRSSHPELFRVGDTLLLGADTIGASPGIAVAPLRPGTPTPLGTPLVLAGADTQALHVAPTTRGFAAVWGQSGDVAPVVLRRDGGADVHGLAAMLAVYECCAP